MVDVNAKGKRWERQVAGYLRDELGIDVRRGQAGHMDDIGDLFGVTDWTFECKDYSDTMRAVREGTDELLDEMDAIGSRYGAAVIKRRRRPVEDAFCVMPLHLLVELVAATTTPHRPLSTPADEPR